MKVGIKFFHAKAPQRLDQDEIMVQRMDGEDTDEELTTVVESYFKELYTSIFLYCEEVQGVLETVCHDSKPRSVVEVKFYKSAKLVIF